MKVPSRGLRSTVARGRWAERVAATRLMRSGYRIVESNFTCRRGEIDLVAWHGDTLCFIEVKARRRLDYGGAAPAVDAHKQARVAAAAEVYLAQNGHTGFCRFDVVTLEPAPDGWSVEVLENAFQAPARGG